MARTVQETAARIKVRRFAGAGRSTQARDGGLTAAALDPRLRTLRIGDGILLTLVLAAALAWPLHAPPIAAHGEAREGLVVQDIVLHGEWTLPRRNGELPSKPPLFHWMAAGAARAVGLSDAVVRLPSAIAGWAMLLATFALGVTIGGRTTAWLAVGALLGTYGFWESAWEARVDMVFAASIAAALVAFFAWYRGGGRVARAGCYIATACAVLAKGPAGAVLPALVIVAFVVRESWRRHRGDAADGAVADEATPNAPTTLAAAGGGPLAHAIAVVGRLWSWPLVALVVLVDAGWYLLAYRRGGAEFLAVQLLHENVDRLVGRGVFGMHGGRSRLAMVVELATDLVPWNLVLVWAAVAWARGARADRGERFLHAWWLVIVGVFTAVYGKRDIYLLPLYPALALLAGRALATALQVPAGGQLFGVVPIPDALRRRLPVRPALALLALAVVVFDVTLVMVSEIARLHSVRRRSLLGFVREVEAQVPPGAALSAAPDLDGSDLQVLAYRLRRVIPRTPTPDAAATLHAGTASLVYVLMPAAAADTQSDARAQRLAVSSRRGTNIALVAVSSAGAPARGISE
ncbi:MAG: glycosyltransferase family 39 protein [Deltaproteobacteria bacterium]|nr:glycosyltransferase family 39 protein [Deltaproteobacteria bacterium]